MKQLLLINPPLSLKERYGKLSTAGIVMPPHGLGYLASYMRLNGYLVNILDCEAMSLSVENATKEVIKQNPDFIGITASTVAVYSAAELAKNIKLHKRQTPLIIGGVHISALPEETMRVFSQFDIGVIGEGEETILELLQTIENKSDIRHVRGLIYRENNNLIRTQPRNLIKNIDALPFPAWDAYPKLTKYYQPTAFNFKQLPSISMITSRGCPYSCSFCSRAVWGEQTYREHSAEYIFKMIKEVVLKYGIRDINIYDDTFGLNKNRTIALCEMLIKEKLNISWLCNLRANIIDAGLLKLMKKSGCWQIGIGIESGSQDILDFMKKEVTLEMIGNAVKTIKLAGLMAKGSIMIGVLGETHETIQKTIVFASSLGLDFLTVNVFTPMPGSLDYCRAEQYGQFNRDWHLLNQYNYVFIPQGLTRPELEIYVKKAIRTFYLRFRPNIWLHYLKMCFDPRKLIIVFKAVTSLLKSL
jgi:anaerobic magnesium-protoporphyrin IX monomethyl ester cyclase